MSTHVSLLGRAETCNQTNANDRQSKKPCAGNVFTREMIFMHEVSRFASLGGVAKRNGNLQVKLEGMRGRGERLSKSRPPRRR